MRPAVLLLPMTMASNIGGTATLIGDPPNIMIGSAAGLTFNVKDTHPDVTISQIAPSKAGDPLGPNKPGGFKITFSEAIDPSSFDATDLSLSTSSASGPALGALVPVTPGSVYTVPVTATGDGTLKLTFTGKAYLAGHDGDANYDNETPTYDDNEIDWDQTAPTATIAPWPGQADPTASSPIEFKVTFSDTISTPARNTESDGLRVGVVCGACADSDITAPTAAIAATPVRVPMERVISAAPGPVRRRRPPPATRR